MSPPVKLTRGQEYSRLSEAFAAMAAVHNSANHDGWALCKCGLAKAMRELSGYLATFYLEMVRGQPRGGTP